MTPLDSITGSLLGTALGDALGLPYEKVSRDRAPRLLGPPDRFRFCFGRGMTSDDTEHSCFVLESLLASQGDEVAFTREMAKRLRVWLLLVPGGTGRATAQACLKLLLGYPPAKSGVPSAGNGPAMRAAVLGAALDDLALLRRLVHASSRITHTHPKAEAGAWVVALAARFARSHEQPDPQAFLDHLQAESAELAASDPGAAESLALIEGTVASVQAGQSTLDFALERAGPRGVSGFVDHTVPVAIHAWLTHPRDYRTAITQTILCGGDADTTAAIAGGVIGAGVGRAGLPAEWLAGMGDWPRTIGWMERLATAVAAPPIGKSLTDRPGLPPRLPIWGLIPRNALFLFVVLFHGFRRMLPPY
ncbi:MAG TPA: ADP-ribosylglycohydrolase family protein [Pirellulales bacterium]